MEAVLIFYFTSQEIHAEIDGRLFKDIRNYKSRGPLRYATHVVCDLEHCYRAIKRRDDLKMFLGFKTAVLSQIFVQYFGCGS